MYIVQYKTCIPPIKYLFYITSRRNLSVFRRTRHSTSLKSSCNKNYLESRHYYKGKKIKTDFIYWVQGVIHDLG